MQIRPIRLEDSANFWSLVNQLDKETKFTLFEAGERATRTSADQLAANLKKRLATGGCLLVIEDKEELVGYLAAKRSPNQRTKQTAYIALGILQDYTGQGLGIKLFLQLEEWARTAKLVRLELTLQCRNQAALALYQKVGFVIGGQKRKALYIDDQYWDEYVMAKLLD